jgi:hypothetical protein
MTLANGGWDGSSYLASSSGRKSSDNRRSIAVVRLAVPWTKIRNGFLLNRPNVGSYARRCSGHACGRWEGVA